MFEQELYNHEAASLKSQEGELFHNYEIKNWNFSPTIYKILAFSAILNIFALAFIGQTNLLTMRGCDSPFVGRVCQVLDTVYLGAVLFGTEREFVDAAYERTDLGDAEITYIDVSGETPPLSYPEGYFQIANPVQYAMLQQQGTDPLAGFNTTVPGYPSNPTLGNDLINTPQFTPKPNPNALQGDAPRSPFSIAGDNPTVVRKNRRGGRINRDEVTEGNSNATAQNPVNQENTNQAQALKPEAAGEDDKSLFNSLPLKDFGEKYGSQILSKQVDINAPFTIEVTAILDENGKLNNPKVNSKQGSDAKMTDVAKAAISAFSDSRLLRPLYVIGGREIVIIFTQDADNLQAIIKTKAKSPEAARARHSSLNLLLTGALAMKNKDSDEFKLFSKTQLTTDNNFLVINFLIPNDEKTILIEKNLKGLKEKSEKERSDKVPAEKANATAKQLIN